MDLTQYPEISVVVPCFNVEHVVGKCINALLLQDYPKDKLTIVIVDDKSTDDTLNIIKDYTDSTQVKIIKHGSNKGLSSARNSGIKASKSTIIGFIDSDMVVSTRWAKNMSSKLIDEDVIACMGGIKLADMLVKNNLDKFLYNPRRGIATNTGNEPIHFKWFLFNNTLIKRYVLDKVGTFDESITSYGGEDTDFALRLWKQFPNGLRFCSNSVGEHYHQRSLKKLLVTMQNYGRTNFLRILDRYPNYTNELDGDWIYSLKGKLVFNPVVNMLVKFVYYIVPIPYLVRYFIAYSLMIGARNPAEGVPKFKYRQ